MLRYNLLIDITLQLFCELTVWFLSDMANALSHANRYVSTTGFSLQH